MINNRYVYKNIISVTTPILLSNLLINLSGIVMIMIISQLGKEVLSASALIYAILGILLMVLYAFSIPISIFSAQVAANAEWVQIKYVFYDGLHLMLLAAIMVLITALSLKSILLFLHQPYAIVCLVQQYFKVYLFGLLPLIISIAINQLFVGTHHGRIYFIFTFISCLLNILLVYLFIKKFPFMNIKFIAMASVFVNWIVCGLQVVYILNHSYFKPLQLQKWSLNNGFTKKIVAAAIPITMQRSVELTAIFVITLFMGWISIPALCIQQILSQVTLLLLIVPFSFMQTISVLVCHVRHDMTLVRKYMLSANTASLFLMTIVLICIYCVKNQLITQFIHFSDRTIISLICYLLPITLLTMLFDNIRNVTVGALRGIQDNVKPMHYSVLTIWFVSLPVAYLLGFVFHLRELGILIGWMSGIILCTLLIIRRSYRLTLLS